MSLNLNELNTINSENTSNNSNDNNDTSLNLSSNDSNNSNGNNNSNNSNNNYKIEIEFGFASLQGRRPSNEDRHVIVDSVEKFPNFSFFGVFDGHAGDEASSFCEKFLEKYIFKENFQKDPTTSIEEGFLEADKEYLNNVKCLNYPGLNAGTTVVVAILDKINAKLYVGNAGDSRCVLEENEKADQISKDHKPQNKTEVERIEKAGHIVLFNRIDGIIAVSRAIGDQSFKAETGDPRRFALTAFPDIYIRNLTKANQFMIIACDGLWDVLQDQQVIDFVKEELFKKTLTLNQICEKIGRHAISIGSTDNVSVVLVVFKHLHQNSTSSTSSTQQEQSTPISNETETEIETKIKTEIETEIETETETETKTASE
eukprot:TRINITY_DN615_c0_g4_i2.p1 TRINITY_DN615_c0_g4~~TRINITY_DN615_c0_g4_i2.p1  ORF type:complete len:383 (-),score=207.93 TRINITY_DN615_c0_g4_i2:4-1119(-)